MYEYNASLLLLFTAFLYTHRKNTKTTQKNKRKKQKKKMEGGGIEVKKSKNRMKIDAYDARHDAGGGGDGNSTHKKT